MSTKKSTGPSGSLCGLLLAGLMVLSPAVAAQDTQTQGTQTQGTSEHSGSQEGTLHVTVTDAETGEPLPATTVRLQGQNRGGITDARGELTLENLSARPYTVVVERLGYQVRRESVEVVAGEGVELHVTLVSSPIQMGAVVVTGTARERGLGEVYRPTTSISGTELQRNLAASVPATLQSVPGFAVQYNGPGAASPTIRGMGGDRVLMLEDGQRTGDLYSSASDHGVMVEPISAQRMEVVRGPAGLIYGSNALGGVVNVVREEVPRSMPSALTGTLSSQYESVNTGVGGGAVVTGPLGPLVFRLEGTGRRADDTRTPAGTLEKTDMRVFNLSAGLSRVADWGFAGFSVRHYDNVYGVPGEFDGELIPGGHPGGVDIEATRTSGRFQSAYQEPFFGFFGSAQLDANVTRYVHDEIEGLIDGQAVVGARFRQTSGEVNLTVHHDHTLHDHPGEEVRAEGALGVSFQGRDLEAGGSSPGTRSGSEWALAAFGFEEFQWGALRFQAGLRYDHRQITPARTDSLVVRTQERRISKPVTDRSFGALSGSVATLWDFAPDWTLGASLARSFRNPAIEELYSDGPHLADFSFDIGSPDLESEVGLGADLFLRADRPDLSVELAAFVNRVRDYIFYMQTGETVRVFREGVPPRVTPVFEAMGEDADFMGVEGRVQWEALRRLVLDGTVSYTRAERRADGDPLPFIPPLSGKAEVRYEGNPVFGSVGIDFSASQNRVPRPIQVGDIQERPQEPTDGYGFLNAGIGWRHQGPQFNHTVTLQVKNLTDREWHDHLSRIKEVAPQPGRNLQLTYRVHF